ncbi:MAG: hypothetical protein U0641_04405 [Anaerolineae bacterium]
MATPASTFEELAEKVHFLEDQMRGLQQALIRQGVLEEESKTAEQHDKTVALIRLLDSWAEGNEREQKETWAYLERVLNEDRPSDRKLFP